MKKKIWTILAAAMMALPLFAGASSVKADDVTVAPNPKDSNQTVNIDLHKLVFDNGTAPTENVQNDGLTMPAYKNTPVPLNGAEFSMYDVSTKYNELLKEGNTAEDAVKAIQKEYTSFQTTAPNKKTTDGEGVASFEGVKLAENGQFKAYLFVETKVPSGVTDKATPLVIAMPVYNGDVAFMVGNKKGDQNLSTINLYPKNEANQLVTKKKITDSQSYSIGDKINYEVTVNVPGSVTNGETNKFEVTDAPNTGLKTLDDDEFTVSDGATTLVKVTDYTVTLNDGGGYTLKLTKPTVYVGKQLVIKYNMMVTSAAPIDQGMVNNVTVTTTTKTGTDRTPPVFTGGYKFIKKDANSGTALAGAKFIVAKNESTTDYAKFDDNHKFTGWGTKEEATPLVSGADGKFSLSGLANESYDLYEVVAPDGYVLPTGVVDTFTIKATNDGTGTFTTSEDTINNSKKGVLPSTGGTGIYAFLAIGAALMVGATIWYKKSKDAAEV